MQIASWFGPGGSESMGNRSPHSYDGCPLPPPGKQSLRIGEYNLSYSQRTSALQQAIVKMDTKNRGVGPVPYNVLQERDYSK